MSSELKSLKHQVDEWRKQSKSPRGRVPDAIKKRVITLLERYSVSDLTKLCGFGNNTIYHWKQIALKNNMPETDLIEIQPATLTLRNHST